MTASKSILVFVEQREGVIHPASLQMLTLAETLANAQGGGAVNAVIIGHEIAHLVDAVAHAGAARVLLADDPELCSYRAMTYTRALCAAIEESGADIVLMSTTCMSRDLAPRVAARLQAALATDCTGVQVVGESLQINRPMYGGKCMATFRLDGQGVRIASVRPNSYAASCVDSTREADCVDLDVQFIDADRTADVIEVVRTGGDTKDVAEADIVVSGGRSLKSEGNFAILYELAGVLDGAVGASRAAVDAGFQPEGRQVGLTGKIVTPRLYIACGIDGAIQHLAGMRGSKVIVAINTKSEAPIYTVATYGCVVDLFTLVPLLTNEIRRLAATG